MLALQWNQAIFKKYHSKYITNGEMIKEWIHICQSYQSNTHQYIIVNTYQSKLSVWQYKLWLEDDKAAQLSNKNGHLLILLCQIQCRFLFEKQIEAMKCMRNLITLIVFTARLLYIENSNIKKYIQRKSVKCITTHVSRIGYKYEIGNSGCTFVKRCKTSQNH